MGVVDIDQELVRYSEWDYDCGSFHKSYRETNCILDKISDVVIVLNANEILYVNDTFEEIFSIEKDKFIKNPDILYGYIEDEDKYRFFNYSNNDTYDLHIKLKAKAGEIKWIRYRDYHLDSNINKKKLIILSDITEIKESEKEIDRLKLEFFLNISHELKTPLNLIFSSSQLLELKCKKNQNSNDSYENYIRIIKQNTLRLVKLINNLIDSTEIEYNHITINYSNKDIISFVENIFNSIEEYALYKNIELIFDTDIEERIVSFDSNKMERALLNILSNAIKFNKDKGKIHLTIKIVDGFITLYIRDTGIGIPGNKLNDIFARFIQVRDRITKVSEGIGMGLSITKSLIEMQGGYIEVNSNLKNGTEFIIKIPDKIRNGDSTCGTEFFRSDYNGLVNKLEIEFSDINC